MTNLEIQQRIQENASILLKGPPEVLKAMGERAHEAQKNVAYFRKLGDKDRVKYEMRNFLSWLKKTLEEQDIYP